MPGLWLARATAEDTEALVALEAECHTHPWTRPHFEVEVSLGPPGALLVIRAAGASTEQWGDLRAYCAYRLVVDEIQIMNVAVAPDWRRRGLGRWILGFCVGKAARRGARRALLEVRRSNREARFLYESLGFSEVGIRRDYYGEPLEDAVVLAKARLPGHEP
jgi:ribosomal-protein-alanine N-acetyltransferase